MHARCVAVNQKQTHAAAHRAAGAVADLGRHQQHIGRRRAHHNDFFAVELPTSRFNAARGLHHNGVDRFQRVTPAALQVGKTGFATAVQQWWQYRFALRRCTRAGDQSTGQCDMIQQGFYYQRFAKCFHGRQHVNRATAKTANAFAKGQGGQAHFGKGVPGGGAESVGRVQGFFAGFKTVIGSQVLLQRIGQLLLLVRVFEIHGLLLSGCRFGSQAKGHFGDDVLLNLVRACVNTGFAVVEITR